MTRRAIPAEIDRRVREAAQNRCGYCLSPQHLVMARLEVEHMIPLAKGGTNDELNLWLACPICNGLLLRHHPHQAAKRPFCVSHSCYNRIIPSAGTIGADADDDRNDDYPGS